MDALQNIRLAIDRQLVGLTAAQQRGLLVDVVQHCRDRLRKLPRGERAALDVHIVRGGRLGWLFGRLLLKWWRWRERKKGG